jgi:hypothetical protein
MDSAFYDDKPKRDFAGMLQPLTVIELLDRTFRIYRNNFATFVAPVAVVTVITTLFSFVYTNRLFELNEMVQSAERMTQRQATQFLGELGGFFSLAVVISLVIGFVQNVLIYGPLTFLTSESHLGRTLSAWEALRHVQGRFGTLIGALIFTFLIVLLLSIPIVILLFIPLVQLVNILLLPYLFYVSTSIYALITPVVILEKVGVRDAVWRGYTLARERFWYLIRVYLLIGLLGVGISWILQIMIAIFDQQSASTGAPGLVTYILSAISQIVLVPITPIAVTLVYYDARVRLEGLDMAMGMVDSPEPRPEDVASPAVRRGLTFDATDRRNLTPLLAIAAVIFLLLLCVSGLSLPTRRF